MSFDAGNFNLNNWNVGGPNRFNKAPAPNQNPAEDTRGTQDKGPRDEVNFGSFTQPLSSPEIHTEAPADGGVIADLGSAPKSEQTFSVSAPLTLNTLTGMENIQFNLGSDITAINGIQSLTISSVSGINRASVNPLNPVTLTPMPTTSVGAVGIEDSTAVTTSGRVISAADGRPAVRMPTTSVGTHGLEDNVFVTTSGRLVQLQ